MSTLSEEIKTESAKKIQNFFLKKYRQYKINKTKTDICIEEKVSIKPDNIYICFNKEGEEKPLVNFFKFKKKDRIIEPDFFINFYNYLKEHIDSETIGENMIFKIHLVNDELQILAHKEIFDKMYEQDELKTFILNFIYYNLINNNIDLKEGISFQITHPIKVSEAYSGIHKDNSIYTCITYINSELTTELAFDTNTIQLEWLKCSPLFRFNTSGQITTLCFSDNYIVHTVPIYEEEGTDLSQLNKLDDNYTMIEEPDDEKTYLKFGYHLDEESETSPIKPINVFYKHEHRKKIKTPDKREILVSAIFEFERLDFDVRDIFKPIRNEFYEISSISIDELQKYKIDLVKEKIELTEDSIQIIRTTKTLGDFELMGGKKKDIQNHPNVIMHPHFKRVISKYNNNIPKEKYKNIIKDAYERPEKYVSKKNNTRKIKKNNTRKIKKNNIRKIKKNNTRKIKKN